MMDDAVPVARAVAVSNSYVPQPPLTVPEERAMPVPLTPAPPVELEGDAEIRRAEPARPLDDGMEAPSIAVPTPPPIRF